MASSGEKGKTGGPRGENRVGVAAIVVQDRLNAHPKSTDSERLCRHHRRTHGVPYRDRGVSVMALIP